MRTPDANSQDRQRGVRRCRSYQHMAPTSRPVKEIRSGNQNLRHDGGGLGAADRLRSAAAGAARSHQGPAGEVGDGLGALLRHEQRPLHHGHAHRHVGAGQDQPLHAAAAERRADPLGLRVRCASPPAELRLARRAVARRHPADARRDDPRDGPLGRRCPQDQDRARVAWPAQGAGRRRRRRAAGALRAAEGRAQHRRRPAVDVGCPRDQDRGRDLAAHALGRRWWTPPTTTSIAR